MNPLGELIADRIRTGGRISFAEFMELSLYHPEYGYYARAAQRTGRAGDFFTSVDVGPLFGELLARQFAEMWRLLDSPASFDVVEAAAGSGRLSRDLLDAAAQHHPAFYAGIRLALVERSPAARAAQAGVLGPHAGLLYHSGPDLPQFIRGVIFANELLDALPTHAVEMSEGGLREVCVDCLDGTFVECRGEVTTPRIAEYLSRAGASLEPGARAEVNLAAEDWIADAARSLARGFLVVIDYGHDEGELYGGSHASGTLTMFHRHTTAFDLQQPGTYDITAHVDLTAVRRAAEREGLNVLGRLDQTYFLMGLAMEDLQQPSPAATLFARADMPRRLALKTLLLPGGLGSTHKVLLFGRGVGAPKLLGLSYRERLT